MTLLFNPWTWLVIVLYSLALLLYGEHDGSKREHAVVMRAWDNANEVATAARQKRIDGNRETMKQTEQKAKAERKSYAENMERMRGSLAIALNGLRDRPNRPSEGHPGATADAAGLGTSQRCSGAGLYRDDAEFLTWRADAAQRIRVQRDACYRLYGAAQEAVSKLQCQ